MMLGLEQPLGHTLFIFYFKLREPKMLFCVGRGHISCDGEA